MKEQMQLVGYLADGPGIETEKRVFADVLVSHAQTVKQQHRSRSLLRQDTADITSRDFSMLKKCHRPMHAHQQIAS